MATPPGRVIPAAIIAHRRPVEHLFDSSAQSSRSFRPGTPEGFQYLEHESGIDSANRQLAEDRERVGPQGADVLFAMLGAAPLPLVGGLIGLRAFGEGNGLRFGNLGRHLLRLPL